MEEKANGDYPRFTAPRIAETKKALGKITEDVAALRARLAEQQKKELTVANQEASPALRKTATGDAGRSCIPKQMTADRERVAGLVREAFGGVDLGGGVGLWQGQALDDYADEKAIAVARLRDEKRDWSAISVDDLNCCHSSLCFFDAEGMRFHLPAFLLAELNETLSHGVLFNLTDLNDYGRSQFAVLSTAQRKAVREFLLLFKDDPNCEFERPVIERALADFWTDRDTSLL